MRISSALPAVLTVAILVAPAAMGGSAPAGADAAESYRSQVQVETVSLLGGDRFRVSTSRNMKTIWGQRYTAATRTWGSKQQVYSAKDVYCGDVDARAAGTSVAITAECDRHGYAEDQAPTHSQALFSTDLVRWQASTLPGEAYEEPGISADGRSAVWPVHEGFVQFAVESGFATHRVAQRGSEYTHTAVITDDELVSLAYGKYGDHEDDQCTLEILGQRGTTTVSTQSLPSTWACADVDLTNTDALTILIDAEGPENRQVVTRADQASPWVTTVIPPSQAPGLEIPMDGPWRRDPVFVQRAGTPLAVVGTQDGRSWLVQRYDATQQMWQPATTLFTVSGRPCRTDGRIAVRGFVAATVRCGTTVHVLASTDLASWWHGVSRGRPPGVAPDSSAISVSNARRTVVYSAAGGVRRLEAGTTGRCSVVVPTAPTSAIRLAAGDRGWPSRLDVLRSGEWRRTQVRVTRVPPAGRCERITYDGGRPPTYLFRGDGQFLSVRLVKSGGAWQVRATP